MFTAFQNMAVAALCVILIAPIASGQASVVFTPCAFIAVSGMFAAILAETLPAE